MADTLIADVSDTAFWMAHFRAMESRRADALFRDPLAGRLAGDRGRAIADSMPRQFITAWTVAIRTCIIDNYIRTALGEGVDTLVNLGAGLDTRPYRMELPERLLWLEADYPKMIEFKEKRLRDEKPRCRLERLSLDLANRAERRRALESVDARSGKLLVLTEGVVPYLSNREVGSLARDLRTLEHARFWIVDYFAPEIRKYRERFGMSRKMQNAPFRFAPADWFGFFGEHGWECREIRYLAEAARGLRRPIQMPPAVRLFVKIQRTFASKKRREAISKLAGYALLQPAPAGNENPA